MLVIRDVTMADVPHLLDIYAPYVEESAISFEYVIPAEEDFSRRVYDIIKKYPYLVAEKEGVIVGYAYATEFKKREAFKWSVETSVYVKRNERNCGIGRELYTALEAELRKRGFQSMCACIAYTNDEEDPYLTNDSVQFHAKMGFSQVAHFHHCGWKFFRWYDIVWMEKLLEKK